MSAAITPKKETSPKSTLPQTKQPTKQNDIADAAKDNEKQEADLRKKYLLLQTTHNLPDFDKLNTQFEIDTIDPNGKHLPREIAKKIFEQIDIARKTIESLMQPDASILAMQEAEFLSETEHEIVADLARRLMRLDRRMLLAELKNIDTEYLDFIKQANEEWTPFQEEFLPLVQKLERGWSNRRKGKQNHHYLG